MNLKKEWKIWKEILQAFKTNLQNLKKRNTLYYLKKLQWPKITDKKDLLRVKEGNMNYHLWLNRINFWKIFLTVARR